jgi:N-methylhydantoinase B
VIPDAVTTEVIRNGLAAAAIEMNRTLVRTAYNPLLYEVQDFGVGIVSGDGRLWAEAPGIAGFISALSDTVRSGLGKLGRDGFRDGDVLIVNDPYLTGTHISDTSVYAPIFQDEELVAFAIVTAHWADIGGKQPSGWSPDTTDVYQEGICFSHQRLVVEGEPNADLFDLIQHNVRYPRIVRGDLDAQIAACHQGISRVRRLCDRYGLDTVIRAMESVISRTDAAMRRRIAELPDGTYAAEVGFDGDGVEPGARPRVCVQVTVAGDRLRITYEGTTPAARGPINDPGARCDVRCALKGLFAPLDIGNEGHMMAFDFDVPPGLLVSPERPAPVDSYGFVGVALIELVIRAMSRITPDRCPANGYQIFGVDLFRFDPRDGEPFVLSDLHDGGAGGRPAHDGPVIVFAGDGDTRNTPAEVIETRFPLRMERHALLPELAGPGRFRGGSGVARDFRMIEPGIRMQFTVENVRDPLAKGLGGGGDGAPGYLVLRPGTEREEILRERVTYYWPLDAGDLISVRCGGGGGWGHPLDREPDRVAADVLDGYVSVEEARAIYGVALEPDGRAWRVDEDGTSRLRALATDRGSPSAAPPTSRSRPTGPGPDASAGTREGPSAGPSA